MSLPAINNLETVLTAAVDVSDTEVNVVSTSGWPATDGIFSISQEIFFYATLTATKFTGLTRGFDGTTPASHTLINPITESARVVQLRIIAKHIIDLQKSTFTFSAGRNANLSNSYLRGPDGVPTNQTGFVLPFDAQIIAMSMATDGPEEWTAEIRKNGGGGAIASLTIGSPMLDKASREDLLVDVDKDDELEIYCDGALITRPVVTIFLRRR